MVRQQTNRRCGSKQHIAIRQCRFVPTGLVEAQHEPSCFIVVWTKRPESDGVREASRVGQHAGKDSPTSLIGFGARRPCQFRHPAEDPMKGRVVLVVLPRVATKRGVPVIALAECFREMLDVQECQCQTAAPRGIRRGSRIADENNSISGGRFDQRSAPSNSASGPIDSAPANHDSGTPVDWQSRMNS